MPYRYPRLLYFVMSIVTAPRVMTVSNRCRAAHGRRWAPVGVGTIQGSGAVGGVRTPYWARRGRTEGGVWHPGVPACCRGLEWWRSRLSTTTLVRMRDVRDTASTILPLLPARSNVVATEPIRQNLPELPARAESNPNRRSAPRLVTTLTCPQTKRDTRPDRPSDVRTARTRGWTR